MFAPAMQNAALHRYYIISALISLLLGFRPNRPPFCLPPCFKMTILCPQGKILLNTGLNSIRHLRFNQPSSAQSPQPIPRTAHRQADSNRCQGSLSRTQDDVCRPSDAPAQTDSSSRRPAPHIRARAGRGRETQLLLMGSCSRGDMETCSFDRMSPVL